MKTISLSQLEALLGVAHDDVEAAHEVACIVNVDLWGLEDDETLSATDLDEAIEQRLDACHPDIPGSLNVCGFRRVVLSDPPMDPDWFLEYVYERLDEEYNSSDDPAEPTPAVEEAALAFLAVVRQEYVPWNCDPVVRVTLDAAEVQRKVAEAWPAEAPK